MTVGMERRNEAKLCLFLDLLFFFHLLAFFQNPELAHDTFGKKLQSAVNNLLIKAE